VTQAQQQFNAAFHQAYVTATGNDPGQSAVSSAWQQYADSMAANYQSLLTQAMTAWQAAGNAEAQAAQALQNNIAGESIPRASSFAGAWTTYVGAVAPAATTLANNLADTGKALVQTLSSHAKNADHQDADNNKALADADANAGKQLADDQTDAVTNAAQNALDAEKPHQQALIDEARDADQQVNGEVTVLAQGGVDEKVDLARDENNEARTAETQLASQDDLVHQAMVQRDQTAAILAASAEYEAISQALPVTFESLAISRSGPAASTGTLPLFIEDRPTLSDYLSGGIRLMTRDWFAPSSTGLGSRSQVLSGIPTLQMGDVLLLQAGFFTKDILAPYSWSGRVPLGCAVGAYGTGPCVGLILVPATPGGITHVYHFDTSTSVIPALLQTGAIQERTIQIPAGWTYGTESLTVRSIPGGYTAYIHGGEGADGLAKLRQVIGVMSQYNVPIGGYLPSSSIHVGPFGEIYWTHPPTMSNSGYQN
jgi:hypothetical protein